jgi:hypothetical protein
VTVHRLALSDEPGLAQLRVPGRNFSWATVEAANTLASARVVVTTLHVPRATLDSCALSDVGFIKLNESRGRVVDTSRARRPSRR